MKKHIYTALSLFIVLSFTACSEDPEYPKVAETILSEDFNSVANGSTLNLQNWVNYAEKGTVKWKGTIYSGNGYAEFSPYNSNQLENKAWLISPDINLDENEQDGISFALAKHHLDSDTPDNTIRMYISKNFNGTDVTTATWEELTIVRKPLKADTNYEFFKSGIDLSVYSGIVNIAFVVNGSGTNVEFDGAFMVDDFNFYKQ